jgi:hypothetical protein
LKRCPICKQPAELRINLKLFCSIPCAVQWGKAQAEKVKAKKQTEQRRADREKLKRLKSQREWADEVQQVFNKMRRLEELLWFKQQGLEPVCISCQKPLGGDTWACGHYKTRGARSDLAFERLNTHLQHNFSCNSHKSGDVDGQKIGYALRYGKGQAGIILADLEVRREVPKRSPDEWIAMKKEFNAEIRRLELKIEEMANG